MENKEALLSMCTTTKGFTRMHHKLVTLYR